MIILPVALLASAQYLSAASHTTDESLAPEEAYFDQQGLILNRQEITNIFPYDADGVPLTDVRLLDQNGNEIMTVTEFSRQDNTWWVSTETVENQVLVPHATSPGESGWSVFPLHQVNSNLVNRYATNPEISEEFTWDWTNTVAVKPPFATLYPLTPQTTTSPEANREASPSPSASPVPDQDE